MFLPSHHFHPGKRARTARNFVADLVASSLGLRLVVLNIVDEVVRYLHFQILQHGDISSDKPTLSIFSYRPSSPFHSALQYLSSLLFCKSGRMVLIFAGQGFRSVGDWEASKPSEVRILRRIVLLASSWIQRRHVDRLEQMPFLLCNLAVSDIPWDTKQSIIDEWDALLPCCARPGFARDLKKRGIQGYDLLDEKWHGFLISTLFVVTVMYVCCGHSNVTYSDV